MMSQVRVGRYLQTGFCGMPFVPREIHPGFRLDSNPENASGCSVFLILHRMMTFRPSTEPPAHRLHVMAKEENRRFEIVAGKSEQGRTS